MINLVKTTLNELVTSETLKRVELSSAPEEALWEISEPEFYPSVLLYYGKFSYSASDQDMLVRQIVDKRIVALLHCKKTEMDSLEKIVVEQLLGLKKDEQHYGLEAIESVTKDIGGEYLCRRIEFSSETKVRQKVD
jgi:hypothetical protein